MQLITPIILILISTGIFFGYIEPTYDKVEEAKAVEAQYDEALRKSEELKAIRESLLAKYSSLDTTKVGKLEKLIPDNVDNVRLIIEIDGIAKKYGMTVKNLSLTESSPQEEKSTAVGPDGKEYASVVLQFSVSAEYEDFIKFLNDLEKSLRVVDVESINFQAIGTDFHEYSLAIRTYWLKQ